MPISAGGGEAPDWGAGGVMSRPAGEALPRAPSAPVPAPTGGATALGAGRGGPPSGTPAAAPRSPAPPPPAGDRQSRAAGRALWVPESQRSAQCAPAGAPAPRPAPPGAPSPSPTPALPPCPAPLLSRGRRGAGPAAGEAPSRDCARPLRSGLPERAFGPRTPRAPRRRRRRLLLSPPPRPPPPLDREPRAPGPWLCPSRAGAAQDPARIRERRGRVAGGAAGPAMELRARGWWLLCAAAALVACARGDPASKSRSCSEVRQIYGAKGFSLSDVPQAEISGEHLRICPQGYTCCTSEMEENLANRSRAELETALRDSSRVLQAMLATQLRSFDDHFQHLLNDSERTLQGTFPGAFGELYTQNTKAFRDLYAELRLYYRGANLHLEETLAEFWARLLERLFKQLHPQLLLPDDYLDCLGKQAEALRPFGEAPRELRLRATRAFVAARSFVQGLGVASDVVRKVAQVPLGPECSRAVMKLVYCAHCLGVPGARPCPDYCRNVLKGCLANQADLDAEWRNLLDSMVLITDKFWGTSGVESVIGSVHTWLAEAINALQDNRDTLTAKVIQGCGNPKVNPQGSGPEEKRRRGKLAPRERPPSGALEKLVSEAKAQLRDVQDFWISLPGTLCSEKMALSTASDDRCWNGMARGRYLPEVMGDGLANQINNPEVEVDITKPDMTIRQQIMQLKIMTNRLRSAYNGNDVDFQDASDDGSGSGSGDGCPDDRCGRGASRKSSSSRTPLTHALPGLSEQEGQKTSAASCPQPPTFLLPFLLSLALTVAGPRWR
uniref:Glypican-1 n=2 Tax=Papio anubis TaxID=9555 RepID=A0A096NEU9_PAPAN